MKNTKKNLIELGKDVKGIGKSLFGAGASLVSLVADTLKVPVSVCKDVRDAIVINKEAKKAIREVQEQGIQEPKLEPSAYETKVKNVTVTDEECVIKLSKPKRKPKSKKEEVVSLDGAITE